MFQSQGVIILYYLFRYLNGIFQLKIKLCLSVISTLYYFSRIRLSCAVPRISQGPHIYCFTVSLFFTCCFCVLLFFSFCNWILFHLSYSLRTVSHSFKSSFFGPYSHRCETRKSRSCVLGNKSLLAVIFQLFCSQFWHQITGQVKPFSSHKEIQWAYPAPSLSGLDCFGCNSITLG